MRLRLASLLLVALSAPVFAAGSTQVQHLEKAERGRDIGGAGERLVTRPAPRPLHVRTHETTPGEHADRMTRAILRGNTPAAAIFPRRGAALTLVGPTTSRDKPPVYRVSGARGGVLPVRLLLPVSGHVDGAHPAGQEVYVELMRSGHLQPVWWPTTRGEVAVHASRHGDGRFMAQPLDSVSAPFDATEALVNALAFARDTRFRIAVGSAPARTVRATGLVTAVDLNLHLRRGTNVVTMAPEGSSGVEAFPAGRSVILTTSAPRSAR